MLNGHTCVSSNMFVLEVEGFHVSTADKYPSAYKLQPTTSAVNCRSNNWMGQWAHTLQFHTSTMLGVFEKPTATQPWALPSRVKSRKLLSSLLVSMPKKKSHLFADFRSAQSCGKPIDKRCSEGFLCKDQIENYYHNDRFISYSCRHQMVKGSLPRQFHLVRTARVKYLVELIARFFTMWSRPEGRELFVLWW